MQGVKLLLLFEQIPMPILKILILPRKFSKLAEVSNKFVLKLKIAQSDSLEWPRFQAKQISNETYKINKNIFQVYEANSKICMKQFRAILLLLPWPESSDTDRWKKSTHCFMCTTSN